MNTLLEADESTISYCVENLGTFYFVCPEYRRNAVRDALRAAADGKGINVHTSYDYIKRVMKVTYSRGGS